MGTIFHPGGDGHSFKGFLDNFRKGSRLYSATGAMYSVRITGCGSPRVSACFYINFYLLLLYYLTVLS